MSETDPNLCPRCVELETRIATLEAKLEQQEQLKSENKAKVSTTSDSAVSDHPISTRVRKFLAAYFVAFLVMNYSLLTSFGWRFIFKSLEFLFFQTPFVIVSLIVSSIVLAQDFTLGRVALLSLMLIITWGWICLVTIQILGSA